MATGNRIRVVLFITELALGGTPRRVQALAERLDRTRFEPHVLSLMPGGAVADALRAAGVPVESLEVRSKLNVLAPLRLRSYLRRMRPHVLHAFNFHANLLAKVVRRWLIPVPVVIVSEASVESAKPRIRVVLDRRMARWADAHYVNAGAVREKLISRERVTADRIWTVRTGVNTRAFAPQLPDESLRRKLGIPPGEPVVVNVGRLDKYKGQEFLLKALKVAAEQGHPFHLILVGEGPLRPHLEEQAKVLGIRERVVFAGPQHEVGPYLALADCFALTSTEEGLPGSLLEAMSMTTASLAIDVGGVSEVIANGTGYLVRSPDPKKLAEGLGQILENPEHAKAVGQEARRRVEAEFSVEQMVKKTEDMYETLVGPRMGDPAGVRAA